MIRVHFKEMDPEDSGRDDYTFDIQVDSENKPTPKPPFFGLWGRFDEHKNRYPVLLRPNGQIDLGSLADAPTSEDYRTERFQRTNLRDREMLIGADVTFWIEDEEFTYKISHIEKL
jgi:hypothetical protein